MSAARSSRSRESSGRPRPREVVAADRSESVEDLAAQEQTGAAAALERACVDLVERDAPAGDFRFLESLVAAPGKLVRREAIDDAVALRLS